MAASIAPQTPVKKNLWLGLVLWRLSAGILYALALLLVPRQLPTAVLFLFAAIVCLPGCRSAVRRYTGLRVGAGSSACGAIALVLGAIVSAGLRANLPVPSGTATSSVVIAAAQAGKR